MTVTVCPECGGKFVERGSESTTLLGYFGNTCSAGRQHDDNCLVRGYACENGHVTYLSVRRTCPCGWKGKEQCFCHGKAPRNEKVDAWPEDVKSPQSREELYAFMKKYES